MKEEHYYWLHGNGKGISENSMKNFTPTDEIYTWMNKSLETEKLPKLKRRENLN
jgi:hypothetical protein